MIQEVIGMSRYTMCPICGHRMRRDFDANGTWNGETYICDRCPEKGEGDSESLSVSDASEIWAANGKDEDCTFGFTEKKLEDAQ